MTNELELLDLDSISTRPKFDLTLIHYRTTIWVRLTTDINYLIRKNYLKYKNTVSQ